MSKWREPAGRELFHLAGRIRMANNCGEITSLMIATDRREDLYRVLREADPLEVDAVLRTVIV